MHFRGLFFKITSFFRYWYLSCGAHDFHSPFIFDFFNEVILAKKKYYAFSLFKDILKHKKYVVSLDRVFFLYRVAYFFRPRTVYIDSPNFPVSLALSLPSLSRKLQFSSEIYFSNYEQSLFESNNVKCSYGISADLAYFSCIDNSLKVKLGLFTCILIESPHENKSKELIWNELCKNPMVSISIDLFKFGILLMNRNQAKEHFVIKM
jgi:hypothetical protein